MPRASVEVPSPIFVEAMSRASIFLGDVERFSQAEVVLKGEFVFSCHCFQDRGFFPVNGEITRLFMGRDTRVAPMAFFNCFPMFFAAGDYFPRSLADIFFPAGASEHVNALLLVWVCLSPAVGT